MFRSPSSPQQSSHDYNLLESPAHCSTDVLNLKSTPQQQNNMCFKCQRQTKYKCVKCDRFACNICSHPADPDDDNYSEFGEFKCVSYCTDCFSNVW